MKSVKTSKFAALTPNRRSAFAMVAGLAIAGASWAQGAFPDRPIRVVVPFGAGSSPDVISRLWGEQLSKAVGQPVIIDNKPGAATIIGTQAVLAAPADGYTLLYTVSNTTSINPYIYKNLPYKAEDLMPVSRILSVPLVLVVSANSPIKSVQQLVQAGKDKPGKMNYASYGIGISTHVAMARFLSSAGISMTHVPYKDGGLIDVMNGNVDVSFEPSTTAMGQLKAGKLRALGVSSLKSVAALPGVPPIADVYPGFVGDSWHGILAAKGTPAPVINKIAGISQQIIDSEEFRKRLTDLGLVPAGGSIREFQAFMAEDAKAWSKVVKDYDIKAE
ncbi:MAG: tripartite tricarboxylate transporter substrate binding protein [Comamonadaceae bacterium]|nr:tripartite tricarboxylate transporter substrate binding protein [Comamonadaceae bacterium]